MIVKIETAPDLPGETLLAKDTVLQETVTIDNGMLLANTVADNILKFKYTKRDQEKAEHARELQQIIGTPSTLIDIVERNFLPNCPIVRADIIATEHIFGPDVGGLTNNIPLSSSNIRFCTTLAVANQKPAIIRSAIHQVKIQKCIHETNHVVRDWQMYEFN